VTNEDGTNPFLGVSCASTSLCVAVDYAGNVVTSTDPTDSPPTWTVTNVDGTYELDGISCGAMSFCLAVDDHGYDVVGQPPVLTVGVSGIQTYGGSPSFTYTTSPSIGGVTGTLVCNTVNGGTAISPSLPVANSPYTIDGSSCSGLSDPSGYNIAYTGVTSGFAVGAEAVTADVSGSQTYGSSAPSFTYTTSPSIGGVTGTLACSTVNGGMAISSSLPVASSPYTIDGDGCLGLSTSSNYSLSYDGANGGFGVSPEPVSATVSGSQSYGSSQPSFSFTTADSNGDPSPTGVANSSLSCSDVEIDGGDAAIASSLSAGSYEIDATSCTTLVASSPDYIPTYSETGNTLSVGPAALTITASSPSMTYGGSVPGITPSYSGFVNGDSADLLTTAPSCTTTATSSSSVGDYATTCSGADDPNYSISYVGGSLSVGPAALTITASSPSMTYGGSVPGITPSYSGFVNGDSADLLTTAPSCTTTATSSSSVGDYATTCSGVDDPNYSISYVDGSLSVGTADLTITASSPSMTYGSDVPTITGSVSGLVGTDAVTTQPTCSADATSSSPVGSYTTSCSEADAGSNYTISYMDGTLSIDPADLTITASSPSMTYGGQVPQITPSYSGFVNGDNVDLLSTAPSCTTTATSSSPVGDYATTCSEAVDPNYSISYVGGSLSVGPAELIITASSPSMTYGGSVPAIAPSYSGFVNGDTADLLTTAPSCSSTASSSSPVGDYATTCSEAVDPNYSISYVGGSLSVGTADLTITASSPSMTYGGAVPTITGAVSGLVGSDTVTTQPTCTTDATSLSPVGSYTTLCSGADAGSNYTISYVDGTLSVDPAELTITASSPSMTYGGSVPAITPSYLGFVNSDNADSLTTPPNCTTSASSSSPAGSYPTSCSGASDPNYSISYVNGTITVAAMVPSAPTRLAGTAGDDEVVLSWVAPSSNGGSTIEGYDVCEATTSGSEKCASPVNGTTPVRATTYTVTGLSNGSTYYFTVEAVNAAGKSSPSNEASATLDATPSAPGSVSATVGRTNHPGDGEVNLAWSASAAEGSSINAYVVTPHVGPAVERPIHLTCGPTLDCSTKTITTTISGLVPGKGYTFTVQASNSAGLGRSSARSDSVVPTTVPIAPARPAAALTLQGEVVLSWVKAPSSGGLPVTGYKVVVSPSCPACGGLLTTGTQVTVSGLEKGRSYAFSVQAKDADGYGPTSPSSAPVGVGVAEGYWLATRGGDVYGAGYARSFGNVPAGVVTAANPVVAIAGTPDGKGYVVVTANGTVEAFGDASFHGDLPLLHIHPNKPVVAIAETADGGGYWLLASDGGFFAFGDAKYHGSVPGLGERVDDVVAMQAAPDGSGYWMAGADGTVWAFGTAHFYSDLPVLHVHPNEPIVSMLPSSTGRGYVLVASDGGAFDFGQGVDFYGSLPGIHVKVNDVVGLALTPDDRGYFIAASNGTVWAFGDAQLQHEPAGVLSHLPVVAIAGV
jgi:hypothetical protein